MTQTQTTETVLTVSALKARKITRFDLRPDETDLRAMAQDLDLLGLRKVSFKGTLTPSGKSDWHLSARLGASAIQPCAVTLAPVKSRLDEDVTRLFVDVLPESGAQTETGDADFTTAAAGSADDALSDAADGTPMMQDDTLELLGNQIDLMDVLREALALALPDYPRAQGASLEGAVFTEPGKDPMTDADARPFAGLASLKDQLTPKE